METCEHQSGYLTVVVKAPESEVIFVLQESTTATLFHKCCVCLHYVNSSDHRVGNTVQTLYTHT